MLLLVIVAEVIPQGMEQLPVYGRYLLANMILLVIAMFLSCFVTFVYNYSGDTSVPRKLRLVRVCDQFKYFKFGKRVCDDERILCYREKDY